jgi:hypothetical protein
VDLGLPHAGTIEPGNTALVRLVARWDRLVSGRGPVVMGAGATSGFTRTTVLRSGAM